MSRSVLFIAGLALLLAVGALIVQFALPSAGGGDEASLRALDRRVEDLERQQGSGGDFRVAYLNVEEAFSVFIDATAELRDRAEDKIREFAELQSEYQTRTISKDEYQRRAIELQAEMLDAQLTIDINALDQMIASDNFADIRAQLEDWRDKAEPLANEIKNLVSIAKMGIVDPLEYQTRFESAQNAFTQFDQGLTQAATLKIVQVAQAIAIQKGYDMVLRVKNVLVYRDESALTDITEDVKSVVAGYL